MKARFDDNVMVVTGAAHGIGRRAAERAASEGARVLIVDRSPARTDVVKAIRAAGGTAQDIIYPDIGHVALAASLASPLRSVAPTRDDVDRFLKGYGKPAGCKAGAAG